MFNNTHVFFLRGPAKFPIFIHTQKRNPQTALKDATMFWDYLSTHHETVHQVMHLSTDRGTPFSYRHINSYSGHTNGSSQMVPSTTCRSTARPTRATKPLPTKKQPSCPPEIQIGTHRTCSALSRAARIPHGPATCRFWAASPASRRTS